MVSGTVAREFLSNYLSLFVQFLTQSHVTKSRDPQTDTRARARHVISDTATEHNERYLGLSINSG